jgi:diketogulonate reductase-like aldo/keto reductase
MRKRKLAGVSVPVVGQGTWQMEGDTRAECVGALRRGLDLGMTHVDTAEMYGSGKVEAIVREAIAGRRDEVYLVSKVLPSNASRAGTVKACEQSLARLGTDRLDLYLLHWPGDFPLEETFAGFEALEKAGKIRAWGLSNFDVDELEQAWSLAGTAIACNQVLYHIEQRAIEHRVIPWCAEHGVPVVAYSPLGQGHFPAPGVGGGVLEEVAERHGATTRQVAMAFLLRHNGMFVIPKAARAAHVEENAAAGDLILRSDEIARIEEAFPRPRSKSLPYL